MPRTPAGPRSRTGGVVLVYVAAVAFLALVAGLHGGFLSPPLPPGAWSVGPLRWVARAVGLGRLGPKTLSVVAIASTLSACLAFAVAVREAWLKRLPVRTAIAVAILVHLIAFALPLLLSFDVFHYSAYGRIVAIHHANPYVRPPADFPNDPLVGLTHPAWRAVPSVYGPAFTQLSAGLARLFRSPASLVVAFKAVSAAAGIVTVLLVGALARRLRQEFASFAVVMVGWTPVVVFDTVAAGENDTLVALFIVLALACVLAWRASDPEPAVERSAARGRRPPWQFAATASLTVAVLVKPTAVWILLLYLVIAVASHARQARSRAAIAHALIVAALTIVFAAPFVGRHSSTLGFSTLASIPGGLGTPSPAVILEAFLRGLVDPVARLLGVSVGHGAIRAVSRTVLFVVFLVAFGALVPRLARRARALTPANIGTGWAWAALLFFLTGPFLFPRYAVWVLPLTWLLPRIPRLSVVGLAVVLPLVDPLGDSRPGTLGSYVTYHDVMTAAVGLGLCFLLAVCVRDLFRRLRVGTEVDLDVGAAVRPTVAQAGAGGGGEARTKTAP